MVAGVGTYRDACTGIFAGWLCRIALNEIRDRSRKASVRVRNALSLTGDDNLTVQLPDCVVLEKQIVAQFGVAHIMRDAPKTAHLARLRFIYGFTTGEIAAQTGLSEGTVKSRIHRIREHTSW